MTLNKTVCGLNINYTERGEGDLGAMSVEAFTEMLENDVKTRALW